MDANSQKPHDNLLEIFKVSHSRLWQWFFAIAKYAQLLLRDGLEQDIVQSMVLSKLQVVNPDKQDALGKHRIEDLKCIVPLNLTEEQIAQSVEMFRNLGFKKVKIPTSVRIHLIGEHKHNGDISMYKQAVEQYVGEFIEAFNASTQQDGGFQPLEPALYMFCTHGNVIFPKLSNIQQLIIKTGNRFIDRSQLSIELYWFDINLLDESRFFTGANPLEYDCVLYLLQGVNKPNFEQRLKKVLEVLYPVSDQAWIVTCIDKFLLYAQSTSNDIPKKNIVKIIQNFTPKLGDCNMESKILAERLADDYFAEGKSVGLLEGMEKGMEKGIEKGRVEGRVEEIAMKTIALLERRFRSVPESVCIQIFSLKDIQTLDNLFFCAIDATSIDDFLLRAEEYL